MSGKQRKAKKAPKPKRERITYIDDGSTVADMSDTRRPRPQGATPPPRPSNRRGRPAPTTRAGRIRQTYFDAVRAMIGPMLITIGGISVVFFLIWVILGFFA